MCEYRPVHAMSWCMHKIREQLCGTNDSFLPDVCPGTQIKLAVLLYLNHLMCSKIFLLQMRKLSHKKID